MLYRDNTIITDFSKIFYWPFQGGTSFVELLICFCSVLCLLCLCARLFDCALWSPAGKGLTSWLSFVVSKCEFVTFPLVSWVKCGTWLYRFLIFAPLLTFTRKSFHCDHVILRWQSEPSGPIIWNSVESDPGCTSRLYFENVTLTLHNVTLASQKPCQHNNKCDCNKADCYKWTLCCCCCCFFQ